MIRFYVNGEAVSASQPMTVAAFCDSRGLRGATAVERNLEIVPRAEYGAVTIRDGDRIEIVQCVGGG